MGDFQEYCFIQDWDKVILTWSNELVIPHADSNLEVLNQNIKKIAQGS